MLCARRICIAGVLLLGLGAAGRSRADVAYLALGDSATFGYDPSTPASYTPSYGDQGFVRPFADSLAAYNGGVRPDVVNLGVVGELSTSFFTGSPPPGWSLRVPELNLNYPDATTAQNDLMVASINAIHAAGNTVGYATFLIGSNDVFYLVNSPAFQAASPGDQQAMLAATIGGALMNYQTVMNELVTLAPEAHILLPGYYNPFPTFAPEHAFYDSILGAFNPGVQAIAGAYGATYVDIAPAFLGRELELTNIGNGDDHPNQAGYAVIGRILTQAVPEPASMVSLAIGGTGLLAYRRHRRELRTRVAA